MNYMTAAQLRESYLSYFEEKGCQRWPSSSLIPDDPSLLLTSAGMVQFKPYFLQQKQLPSEYIGTTTAQKCLRTNDIDNIGHTGRHQSFFEMLGNFSFGRYFKKEMCAWAYEFSTKVMGIDPDRLYYTVYTDDDETYDIWRSLGISEDHISRLGEDDNFWAAGPTGPCGPCSELYYDQGPEVGCGRPDCAPGCECDRFLEFWNLVFTQYDRQEDGTLVPLPHKNIDTGMGLERAAAILQGVNSNYETDILQSIIAVGCRLSGREYGVDSKLDLSLRIIADHSRAITFMIADGIMPSNEGRGYILRRLLRRAVRHGQVCGIEGPFLREYVDAVIAQMGDVYPETVENQALIEKVVTSEEERFGLTLKQGQGYLDEALSGVEPGGRLDGKTAFTLHDTYGFPIELTSEICTERGYTVDLDVFASEMEAQRERARGARDDDAWEVGSIYSKVLAKYGETEFCGYTENSSAAQIYALVKDGALVDEASEGDEVGIVLDRTPFYGEMGGQVGDTGTIEAPGCLVEVNDTKIPEKGLFVHKGVVKKGTIRTDAQVYAAIDVIRRARIRRNHTATHILHWALRNVLGDHVKQAGSYVAPDRLRFDFTHFEAMTPEQVVSVEHLVNDRVMEDDPVTFYETSLVKARESGVTALFGEKYGEYVRVLEVGDFSKELCGGTHISHTSEIGFLKILSESSIASNVRRIEAVTSYDALRYVDTQISELRETAAELNVPPLDVSERTAANIKRIHELETRFKQAKQAATENDVAAMVSEHTVDVGYPLVVMKVPDADASSLRQVWDVISNKLEKPGAAVLASTSSAGAPLLLAAGSVEAIAAGFDAGKVIKTIAPAIKGGGGGKPSMAQAGGKDASGIDAALAQATEMLR